MGIVWLSANLFGLELLKEAARVNPSAISAIITLKEDAKTKMYDGVDPELWKQFGIPVYYITRIEHEEELLRTLNPDYLLMMGWRQMLPNTILRIPHYGTIGSHPTMLPKGRGPAPIINTLLNGLSLGGVSFFYVDIGMDSGDLLDQEAYEITYNDHTWEVYQKVISVGKTLIRRNLSTLLDRTASRTPQVETFATTFEKPASNELFWEDSLEIKYRKIKAFSHPYNGAYLKKNQNLFVIWRGAITSEPLEPSLEIISKDPIAEMHRKALNGGYIKEGERKLLLTEVSLS